jgi:hypothetical protein
VSKYQEIIDRMTYLGTAVRAESVTDDELSRCEEAALAIEDLEVELSELRRVHGIAAQRQQRDALAWLAISGEELRRSTLTKGYYVTGFAVEHQETPLKAIEAARAQEGEG